MKKKIQTDTPILVHSQEIVNVTFPLFFKHPIVEFEHWEDNPKKRRRANRVGVDCAIRYICVINSRVQIEITECYTYTAHPKRRSKWGYDHKVEYQIQIEDIDYRLSKIQKEQAVPEGKNYLTAEQFHAVFTRAVENTYKAYTQLPTLCNNPKTVSVQKILQLMELPGTERYKKD